MENPALQNEKSVLADITPEPKPLFTRGKKMLFAVLAGIIVIGAGQN